MFVAGVKTFGEYLAATATAVAYGLGVFAVLMVVAGLFVLTSGSHRKDEGPW